jgi:hypothetical protein
MALTFRPGTLPLAETARALSFAGWTIDSVDDQSIRAHRVSGPLTESLGIDSWFNDGYVLIDRRDGQDEFLFRQCYPKTLAVSLLAALPGLAIGHTAFARLGLYAAFVVGGLLIDRLGAKPRERAMQQTLDQNGLGVP